MWKYNLFLFGVLALSGCKPQSKKTAIKNQSKTQPISPRKYLKSRDVLEETYVDSLNIGLKGFYKLELKKFRNDSGVFINFSLFAKQKSSWIKKQEYQAEKDGVTLCDVSISDFNHDGLNDMTYQSAVAARGANELRKLFIFNKSTGRLVFIKKSDSYPNLLFNNNLKCIDALLISGSYTTIFLHIQQDSLAEYASVDLRGNLLSVTVTDRLGRTKYLVKEKKSDWEPSTRFRNFNPVESYPDSL